MHLYPLAKHREFALLPKEVMLHLYLKGGNDTERQT